MEIVDANVVLRYLLEDHKAFYAKAKSILEQKEVHIPTEVVAEIVYVLEKVYKAPRDRISDALVKLFQYPNITTSDLLVLNESMDVYISENIDFVDALLVSYNRVHNYVVHSFDKKVKKLCKQA